MREVHLPAVVEAVETAPTLVIIKHLTIHHLRELEAPARDDDLDATLGISENVTEILGGDFGGGQDHDKRLVELHKALEDALRLRERWVGDHVRPVIVLEEILALVIHVETQIAKYLTALPVAVERLPDLTFLRDELLNSTPSRRRGHVIVMNLELHVLVKESHVCN